MITSTKINTVQSQIKLALQKIERENDVKISFGTRRYNDTEYGTRMTVKTTEKSVSVTKSKNTENLRLSKSYGFSKNIIGESFVSNGKKFTITEFKTRNRKYPIIATTNGKGYKFTTQIIKSKLL